MTPRHIALATLVALVWGVNFVVIHVGLESFPPLLLVAMRFALAGLPALFLPRPALSWKAMLMLASALFVGQFGLLFTAMAVGMPPGLASITLQTQAFLTIIIAAIVLREVPRSRQVVGSCVAFAGLACIAATAGGTDVSAAGFMLTIAAAFSWAIGNVLLRQAGQVDMLAAISWLSLLSLPPLVVLSLAIEGPAAMLAAFSSPHWAGWGAASYNALLSTTFGYAVWGHLMKLYPAGTVAPFALLVPVFGTLSAMLLLGEQFGPIRFAGMGLIFAGLMVIALPTAWIGGPRLPS